MTSDWIERWQEGRIGWHEAEGNRSLKRHWQDNGQNDQQLPDTDTADTHSLLHSPARGRLYI